jgi:alcohol dehydrogenase (NADP+)
MHLLPLLPLLLSGATAQEALLPTTPAKGTPLNNLPALGLGTWYLRGANATEAVAGAIHAGYRLIDCAYIYNNQKEVGAGIREGIRRAGISRSDVWVTSKLWNSQHNDAQAGLATTLAQLGLDYIDLFLMHYPMGSSNGGGGNGAAIDSVATWKRMEALPATGKTRFIGISNHSPSQVQELLRAATIRPKVHQIELHPYLPQSSFVRQLHALNVSVNAYAPLANTNTHYATKTAKLLTHPMLVELARRKKGCSVAQLVLAWNMARAVVPIPKAAVLEHARENLGAERCLAGLGGEDLEVVERVSEERQFRFNDLPCAAGKCWEGLVRGA